MKILLAPFAFGRPQKNGVKKFVEWSVKQRTRGDMHECLDLQCKPSAKTGL
jgi:hypothetical protein